MLFGGTNLSAFGRYELELLFGVALLRVCGLVVAIWMDLRFGWINLTVENDNSPDQRSSGMLDPRHFASQLIRRL